MKILNFLLCLLSLQLIAAPLPDTHPGLIPDRAKAIHVKKTYLKNADKKMKILKKKISLLKARESLSKKATSDLEKMKIQLNKLLLWQGFYKVTKSIIIKTRENTPEAHANLRDLHQQRDKIVLHYKEMTSEDFPKRFDIEVYQIRKKLKKQIRKKK